jgi:autoinducer 2-degrading protein
MGRHQGSEWTARHINTVLVEVYRDDSAPAEHKKTAHYQVWRDTVAEMVAEPRTSIKYDNVFPDDRGWG